MTQFYTPSEQTNIMLNVTDACNLACRYCFVTQHPHYMTLQVAKDAVDFLSDVILRRSPGVSDIRELAFNKDGSEKDRFEYGVNFFGGEPLLMWDEIIVPLTEWVKSEKLPFNLGITSNCILLDDRKMDFMKKNRINLLFSIDGDKETQDYNRPCHNDKVSSFDILEPKMEKIAKEFGSTFRSTLIPKTCHNLMKNIEFAQSKGFRNYFACPDDFSTWTENDILTLERELYKISLYYIDCYCSPESLENMITFSPINSTLEKLSTLKRRADKSEEHRQGFKMCGLGTGGFAVNYEGAIFACQELPSRGYENNLHYIGNIYSGYNGEAFEKLLQAYRGNLITCENPDLCKDCYYRYICADGYCHANGYIAFNNECTKARIRCVWDNMLVKYASFIVEALKDTESFQKKFSSIIKVFYE